jgi:Domain of unknown function (DUF3883)
VTADNDVDTDKGNPHWTTAEVAVAVGSYFLMLAEERAGRPYSKTEYRKEVMKLTGRSKGSVEWKLRNVSAVLDEIGIPWLTGYLPAENYQDLLINDVEGQLLQRPELFNSPAEAPLRSRNDSEILVAAPPLLNSRPEDRPTAIRRLVGKFDPAARDARNRDLGRAGEEFVVDFERSRLWRAGRGDLAKEVRWVADLDGDGYGYDVRSFDPDDGHERLLEIKTTYGNERTPFWLTRRECDVATERHDVYRIRRVFHFRNEVKMFDIAPPLEARLLLTPTTFMAAPR